MLQQMLAGRNLPPLKSREEMLQILQEEVYGFLPERPLSVDFQVQENLISHFCAGHATLNRIEAHLTLQEREFSFPFYAALRKAPGPQPFFVHINFRPEIPDRYMPTEELIDMGFSVFSFCYEDITKDNGDFADGLAGILFQGGLAKRGPSDAGKIALWAYAAMRVMDFAAACTDRFDLSRSVVCGHSRLGKTALLAGALDERFAFTYSNDSGCSGAALSRGTRGETVADITKTFPYWFCERYAAYAGREASMPFDQHYLLAAIAPRRVLIGSASKDDWADPLSEQLSALAASGAFPKGLTTDRPAQIQETFLEGDIGYHLREGEHYFSRRDWQVLAEFVDSKNH